MAFPTKRKYYRYSDHIPILYAEYNAKSYNKATMYNSCPDGMYFESTSRLNSNETNINYFDWLCDYCEKRTTDSLIHQTETGLLLCPDCCYYMETLPRSIEEDLERFLIGNVV
jgi:hypothetical protein